MQLFRNEQDYTAWCRGDQEAAPATFPEATIVEEGQKLQNDSSHTIEVNTYGSALLARTEDLLLKMFGTKEEKDQQEEQELGEEEGTSSPSLRPSSLNIFLETAEERHDLIRAIGFMDAAQSYAKECRRLGVAALDGWMYNLQRGDASELMVATYGHTTKDRRNTTSSSDDISPLSIEAVARSLERLDVVKRLCGGDKPAESLPPSLFLRRILIRGIHIESEHVLALKTVALASNAFGRSLESSSSTNQGQEKGRELHYGESRETSGFGSSSSSYRDDRLLVASSNLISLSEIDMTCCYFTRDGQSGRMMTMPSLLDLLKLLHCTPSISLRQFALSDCDLDGESCVHAFRQVLQPGAGQGLYGLDMLNLADNSLPAKVIVQVLNSFEAESIGGLDLAGNFLENNVDLVSALWRHKPSLERLSLAHCAVSEGVLATVVSALVSSGTAAGTGLQEIDLRGNILEGQVVSVIANALASSKNALVVAHMGEGMPKAGGFVNHTENQNLIDLMELQHNLTHHRFGRPEYKLATLSLVRDTSTISSTTSAPCCANLFVSGLSSCFEPSLYAMELSQALAVPVRHFTVQLREEGSFEGRLSVQLVVSNVQSLTIGDENANRTVVSSLVDMVSACEPTIARLRIVEITMIKRERVPLNLRGGTPGITDNSPIKQRKTTGTVTTTQANEIILRRMQEKDPIFLSLLTNADQAHNAGIFSLAELGLDNDDDTDNEGNSKSSSDDSDDDDDDEGDDEQAANQEPGKQRGRSSSMPHISMSFKSTAAANTGLANILPQPKRSKPPPRWVLRPFASNPTELSDRSGLQTLPVASLRADMYECIRKRDRVALQELSVTPLVLGQLERQEVHSLVDLLESHTLALQLLGHAVSGEPPKQSADDSRILHAWVREMEHAIAVCAVVGLDAEGIVPLREALDLLSIGYGRLPDTSVQQMKREILGAMFGRDFPHLRRVVHTCEKVRNIPEPEHMATLLDQARIIIVEQKDMQSRLVEAVAVNALDVSMLRGVAMDAAIAMLSPASDTNLKEVLRRLHMKSGVDHLLIVLTPAVVKREDAVVLEIHKVYQRSLRNKEENIMVEGSGRMRVEKMFQKYWQEQEDTEEQTAQKRVAEKEVAEKKAAEEKIAAAEKVAAAEKEAGSSLIQSPSGGEKGSLNKNTKLGDLDLLALEVDSDAVRTVQESISENSPIRTQRDPVDVAIQMLSLSFLRGPVHGRSSFDRALNLLHDRSGCLSTAQAVQTSALLYQWSSCFSTTSHLPLLKATRVISTNKWSPKSTISVLASATTRLHAAICETFHSAEDPPCATSQMLLPHAPDEHFALFRWPGLIQRKTDKGRRALLTFTSPQRNQSATGARYPQRNQFRPLTALNEDVDKKRKARQLFSLLSHAMEQPSRRTTPGGQFSELRCWLGRASAQEEDLTIEAYLQIAKQLRSNPNPESCVRGWRCMLCLLYLSGVPATFAPYLQAHLAKQVERDILSAPERMPEVARAQNDSPEAQISRARRACSLIVASGGLACVLARQRSSRVPSERELHSIFVHDVDRSPLLARIRVHIPGRPAVDVDVLPFTRASDVVAQVVRLCTARASDATRASPLWENFSLYLPEEHEASPAHHQQHRQHQQHNQHHQHHQSLQHQHMVPGLRPSARIGSDEDVRWTMSRSISHRSTASAARGITSLQLLPDVRMRCSMTAERELAESVLGDILYEIACKDLQSGRRGYSRASFAYVVALAVRAHHCTHHRGSSLTLATVHRIAGGIVPRYVGPEEIKELVDLTIDIIQSIPSDDAAGIQGGGGYYRAAMLSLLSSWPSFGVVVFDALTLLPVPQQDPPPLLPPPPLLTLSIATSGCVLYKAGTSEAVVKFQLQDIHGCRIEGAGRDVLVLDLGPQHGKAPLGCRTTEECLQVATCLLNHCQALLRCGRGRDRSSTTSFWWFELMYPTLPPPPLPTGINESDMWDAAIPSLSDVVLATADKNSVVHVELLSDIESICYGTRQDHLKLSDFVEVLRHLNVLPGDVHSDRLIQLLDPDEEDKINFEEFVELLRKEMNQ